MPPTHACRLVQGGYTILHIGDVKDVTPDWGGTQQMPAMEEVGRLQLLPLAGCGVAASCRAAGSRLLPEALPLLLPHP